MIYVSPNYVQAAGGKWKTPVYICADSSLSDKFPSYNHLKD
jgi:hypothetical protein